MDRASISHLCQTVEGCMKNRKLTLHTKGSIYRACVLSTLLYCSESLTLYSRQERRLNTFHMCYLRGILYIKWSDKVTKNEVLTRTGLSSLYTLLWQCHLCWLGHVSRMTDGRIPKGFLYGELASSSRGH